MLDTLALVVVQEFLDLRLVVLALIKRYADLAVRTGHRFGEQPGGLALDVEISDLAEIEHPLVEARPGLHVAAADVVGQMIDISEPGAIRLFACGGAGNGDEI